MFENFNLTHGETDYLLSYADENSFDSEQERLFLEQKAESPNEIELIAIVWAVAGRESKRCSATVFVRFVSARCGRVLQPAVPVLI